MNPAVGRRPRTTKAVHTPLTLLFPCCLTPFMEKVGAGCGAGYSRKVHGVTARRITKVVARRFGDVCELHVWRGVYSER